MLHLVLLSAASLWCLIFVVFCHARVCTGILGWEKDGPENVVPINAFLSNVTYICDRGNL